MKKYLLLLVLLITMAALLSDLTFAQAASQVIEDDSADVEKYGSWSTDADVNHHGGTAIYSNTSGNELTIIYHGNGFSLYGTKGPDAGTCGVAVVQYPQTPLYTLVSLYSAETQYQVYIYGQNLTYGWHTIAFKNYHTKNPASSDYYTQFDYLTFDDTLPTSTATFTPTITITPTITNTPEFLYLDYHPTMTTDDIGLVGSIIAKISIIGLALVYFVIRSNRKSEEK